MQELAVIQVCSRTYEIVDVFLEYGFPAQEDVFARNHVHGLSREYLKFRCVGGEEKLIACFQLWLQTKGDSIKLFASAPFKESQALNVVICDAGLPGWLVRKDLPSHRLAISYKNKCIPILTVRCVAHSSFVSSTTHKNPVIAKAKHVHGHHCALYDAYELYLFFVNDRK